MAGVSSLDCISPAFGLMRKRLFEPFRFGYWSRIAVLGVLAGELASGGGGGGGGKSGTSYSPQHTQGLDPIWIAQHWNIILSVVGVLVGLGLLFYYLGSVFRFVLYEAVLRDRADIKDGFMRWRDQGLDYFSFRLTMVLPYAFLVAYLVGLPLLRIIKAGGGGPEVFGAFAQLAGALLFVGVLGIALVVGLVLTKDFVVPQMMIEGVGCFEGWRRLWRQIQAEPMSFLGYVLLKMVLAIGAFILFGIMMLILLFLAIIPAGVVVAIGVFAFKAIGGGTLAIIAAVALAVAVAIPVAVYCVGFVGAPISVFFPAYSMQFFASRYAPLYNELHRPPSMRTP